MDTEVPIINWFEEPAKKSINSVFGGVNSAVEALDLFRKYRAAHFSMLKEIVGKVKVLGMSSPISLADLYYPTLVSSDIRRRLYQSVWLNSSSQSTRGTGVHHVRAIDGGSYVEKCDRLVVLGGPGAGKTTFLKFLALAFSDGDIFSGTKLKTSKLPFFVSLPDLAKGEDSVLDFMAKPLVAREGEYAKDFIVRALKKGLSIVLFDSLDEVPDGKRSYVIERIREFCRLYPSCKVVVSCRTADYKEVLESFDEVELVKLSAAAVKKIVNSWFKGNKQYADRLIQVIENDSSIANLTETPLLLSLLCIQFRHDLVLPRRKVEVYKRCVEALLREWDTTRGFRRESAYESLSDLHKERLFECIAGAEALKEHSYVISDEKILGVTADYISRIGIEESCAQSVIAEIERHHGIVERHSLESYCFSHSSIHDYFTARYALSHRIEMDVVRLRLEDESWASIIEFICGLHAEPDQIFDLMVKRATLKDLKNYPAIERRAKLLFLVYRCMSVGPTLGKAKADEIGRHIVHSMQSFVRLMADSGVYPMCSYGEGGVRHPYFHLSQKRPSLHSALLPYRKLSNEILVRPVPSYARSAIASCDELLSGEDFSILEMAVVLNTIVPLAKSDPDAVLSVLDRMKVRLGPDNWWNGLVDESRKTIIRAMDS